MLYQRILRRYPVPNITEILFDTFDTHIARDSWETCWIAPVRKAYLF
jgi:hypothetical protein